MKKTIILLTIGLLLSAGAIFANGTQESATEEIPTIRHMCGLKNFDPIYLAEQLGYFDEVGINVELIDTSATSVGVTGVQALDSGNAETTTASLPATINAVNSGLKVIQIADLQTANYDYPIMCYYVRKDSGIDSIEDLKGKTIGINLVRSSFHYTWLMALSQHGLTEDDVTFVQISFPQLPEALSNGTIDAMGVVPPYNAYADTFDDLEILFYDYDIFGGEYQQSNIVMSTEAIEKLGDEKMNDFIGAIVKAMEWSNEHKRESAEIIGNWAGIDPSMIYDYEFNADDTLVLESYEMWKEFMIDYEHQIPEDFDVTRCFTSKYNPNCQ